MKNTSEQHKANTIYEYKECNIDLIEEKKCTLCGEKTYRTQRRARVVHTIPLRRAY